ncbi:glycosyltransferase family 39 protein [Reyranella soli]|uniref:Glycosyl transferase n=1 Tax=Reyranella soli TaxID=1230389 RepID=A0A512NEW9_9HYPH|nr:glycosyltransferase family 39 protein [Reyranella soli]GEP57486.1 glycosyl transferase [Reyranella soli]
MTDQASRRRIEWAAFAAVLLVAAALRLIRLEDNGVGTAYYAAGVRSMLQSVWLFFYNSFDPAGFISLDKPPIAFWIQTVFAAVLGYSGWAIHLPQALAGIASVALLYRLVRPLGAPAAILAALLLAIMPIAVAIDRSNNTDSWLILFLLLAARTALRGRGLSLVVAMALLGLAFNTKMLAALVCGPALLAGWLLAGTLNWRQRLGWMTAAAVTLAVVSLSWAVAFDLTPQAKRPYAGSSHDNSMLELIIMHNGLERFVRNRPTPAPTPTPAQTTRFVAYDAVPVGPLRLAAPALAMQFAWTLPLAVLGAVFAWRRRRAQVALWSVWALTYAIVYSAAGGIFHGYYLSTLGPPLAALASIGCFELWKRGSTHLAVGLGAAALWQGYVAGASLGWTSAWVGFPAVALLAAMAAQWRAKRPPAVIGGVALLVLPAFWSLSAVFAPGNLTLPSASLPRWLGIDDGRGPILSRNWGALTDDPKLQAFLKEHRGNARFLLAAPNALLAAPVIIRTGQPAMAFGGFFGNDPVMSVDAFAKAVERGEVRFVVLATNRRTRDFERWVRTHGTVVDPSLWRSLPPEPRRAIVLYDLGTKS